MNTSSLPKVSPDWTPDERKEVAAQVSTKIKELNMEEAARRETCNWEAPFLKEIERKRQELKQVLAFVEQMPSEFLELNRSNFSEFLAKS